MRARGLHSSSAYNIYPVGKLLCGLEPVCHEHRYEQVSEGIEDIAYESLRLPVHILQQQFPAGEPEREILYTEFF